MSNEIMACLAKDYDLFTEPRENTVYRCLATDLLKEENMKSLLAFYTPLVKGKEQSVGEAYMTSWFRGPMLGLLYILSAWNKTPNLSLNNLTVEVYSDTYNDFKYYRCGFLLHEFELEEGPEQPIERNEWAKEKLSQYFEYTIRPVFESIAKVGSLGVAMLWGQLPTSLQYGYDTLMNSDQSDQLKQQVTINFESVKLLEAEIFGRKRNPFDVKVRLTESMDNPDRQIKLKNACCMYYLVEDGSYCFSCPRIKESEREERRVACRAQK